jgi:hypothetical protein
VQIECSVVPIEIEDVDPWLLRTVEQVVGLVQVPEVEAFDAGPM